MFFLLFWTLESEQFKLQKRVAYLIKTENLATQEIP